MGQTATVSTAIIDSTLVGRELITAADEAAARLSLELSATDDVTFSSVSAVDGDFSGDLSAGVGRELRLYDFGVPGDTDTRWGGGRWSGAFFVLGSNETGSGGGRDVILSRSGSSKMLFASSATTSYSLIQPLNDSTLSIGTDTQRWLGVYSVNGDFSGELTAPTVRGVTRFKNAASNWIDIDASTTLQNLASISSRFSLTVSATDGTLKLKGSAGVELQHDSNGTKLSTTTTGVSVDGNLNTEVGGSQRVYNLGTEGDVDSEYLETSWTANSALIASKATGTGVLRNISIGSDSCHFESKPATNQATIRTDSIPRLIFLGGVTKVWNTTEFSPKTTAGTTLGSTSFRWSNVYSVAGNFSGNVIMAANVDFTGLPTADPVVAGRLWNDGGTMKISAG